MSDTEDAPSPLIQACPGCGGFLDVSEQEPFAQVHCPSCGTLLRVRTQVRNFTLQSVVGVGGMGTVYKALDLNLQRVVALKILRREFSSSTDDIGKLEREARLTAMVNHPNVVKIYSFGDDHGQFYLSMELVEKGSLDDLLELQGQVAELQVLEIGIQVASGLQAAHQLGLIHRDVKPGNILFADAHMTKIVDFGLAIVMEEEAAQRGEIWGTPYYVAPEKLDQRPEDFRSDIYSLGGTMFHALSGRPPYEAQTASLVALKHLKSQPVSLQAFAPNTASETAYVVNKMLHKDPDSRYQSYEELIEHLNYARERVTEAVSSRGRPRQRVVVDGEESKSRMGWIVLGCIGLILLAGIGVWAFRGSLFPREDSATVGEEADTREAPSIEAQNDELYSEAQALILKGDFATAEGALFDLLQRPGKIAEPARTWIRLHAALAAYLGDNPGAATELFESWQAELQGQDTGKLSLEMANMVDAALRVGTGEQEPSTSFCRLLDRSGPEAFVILLCAAINWQKADFRAAQDCLRLFTAARQHVRYTWIGAFKPLANRYLDDAKRYVGAVNAMEKATDSATTRKAAQDALQTAQEIQTPGPIVTYLTERANLFLRQADEDDQNRERRERKAREDLERRTQEKLAQTGADYLKAVTALDLDAAAALLAPLEQDPQLRELPVVRRQEERLAWLREFKTALIEDLNASGYNAEVRTISGSVAGKTVSGADSDGVSIASPYGTTNVPWKELPPELVVQMAESFARTTTGADAGKRLWLAGVFAHEAGLSERGKSLLIEGSQADEALRDQLGNFFEMQSAE